MAPWSCRTFILDDNNNPVEADMMTAARFFGNHERTRVAFTDCGYGVSVSTVFLMLEHIPFDKDGNGCLFETMVFTSQDMLDDYDHAIKRYRTWGEAEAGHNGMVLEVMRAIKKTAN